jgi:hypothetical protein
MKKVRISQVVKAIEENGYEHNKTGWFDQPVVDNLFPIRAACVFGQGALNLGVSSDKLAMELNVTVPRLYSDVSRMNDSGNYTYKQLVKAIRERVTRANAWNKTITVPEEHYHSEKIGE